jgi:hypothetical protein
MPSEGSSRESLMSREMSSLHEAIDVHEKTLSEFFSRLEKYSGPVDVVKATSETEKTPVLPEGIERVRAARLRLERLTSDIGIQLRRLEL